MINRSVLKLVFIVFFGTVAVLSARDATVFALGTRAPHIARKLVKNDATSVVSEYDRKMLAGVNLQDESEFWHSTAQSALRDNPLSPGALRVMALSQEKGKQDDSRFRSLMQMSERVSRRDLATQIWLIEDAVDQGDLALALSRYDRALSVSPGISGQLFPVLANALDAPEIREALVPYLRSDRLWVRGFLQYAVSNSSEPLNLADLFKRYGGSSVVPNHKYLETLLLGLLVSSGDVSTAWDYTRRLSGPGRNRLGEFDFTPQTLDRDLRPFAWSFSDDARAVASFDSDTGLKVAVSPGVSAVAAYRVLLLKPGRWELLQTVELPTLGPMANSSWTASCLLAKGPSRFWIQDIPLRTGMQTYRSVFDVPENCPGVRFDLIVRGSDFQEEARITVSKIGLTPL